MLLVNTAEFDLGSSPICYSLAILAEQDITKA